MQPEEGARPGRPRGEPATHEQILLTPQAAPLLGAKDQFSCFLSDQPTYLVPARLREAKDDDEVELVVNPDASVPWCEAAGPPAPCPLPEGFLAHQDMVWIRNPATGAQTPFWADDHVRSALGAAGPGARVTADIPRSIRAACLGVRLLVEPGSLTAATCGNGVADASRSFATVRYALLNGSIHPYHIGSLRRYYRRLLRTGRMAPGHLRGHYVAHNESVARFFHSQLTDAVAAVTGARIKPSYSYVVSYQAGADLPAHTDRAQCEYTLTILLDVTPEPRGLSPWSIQLETKYGPVVIRQALGDGLVFAGREVPHYRPPLPEGMTSTSMLFHYVDREFAGPLD